MKTRYLVLSLISLALMISNLGCKPLIAPGKLSPTPPGKVQKTPVKQAPEQPAATVSVEAYFPVTVGSEWYYQGEGNEYATFNRKILFREGTRAQFRDDNGGAIRDSVVEFSEDGLARIYNEVGSEHEKNLLTSPPKEKIFILVTPLKVGTKWRVPEGSREIVDVNATVDTPAGVFRNCLQVQVAAQDSVTNEYYCPGIGLVKQDFQYGDQAVTSLLSRYTLK